MSVSKVHARTCVTGARTILLIVIAAAGCKGGDDGGANDFQRRRQGQEDAVGQLRGLGAKLNEVVYPQGKAWTVDLSGKQITNETFDTLKKLGHITELNLSKTNVTDEDMSRVNEMGIGNLLLKLDLSHTAITDTGLAKLDGLYLLSSFNLTDTKVTKAGIDRFKAERNSNSKIGPKFKSPSIQF
jgi:Leucine Rich repeat